MCKDEAIFERLFILETKENKSEEEKEEFRLLKSMETKKEYEYDEEDEEECYSEAERVGMVQTIYGWM